MISQKKMNEWYAEAERTFQSAMPPIDIPYPEHYILSEKTASVKRAEIVNALQSPQKNPGIELSQMETIYGNLGDAVIIYQKNIKENRRSEERTKQHFMHCSCHELGHFYSRYTECPEAELYRYMDQQPREGEEAIKQTGYWFWAEFIAEVIACHIDPDVDIDWNGYDWHAIRFELVPLIRYAFHYDPDYIDQYGLAHYYAKLLSDKRTTAFLEAAKDGRARVNDPRGSGLHTTTLAEAGIDPDCRSEIEEVYYPVLDDFEAFLRCQLSKERYWTVTPDDIMVIGNYIGTLREIKLMNFATGKFGEIIRRMKEQCSH